jgi:hypothetical protein
MNEHKAPKPCNTRASFGHLEGSVDGKMRLKNISIAM